MNFPISPYFTIEVDCPDRVIGILSMKSISFAVRNTNAQDRPHTHSIPTSRCEEAVSKLITVFDMTGQGNDYRDYKLRKDSEQVERNKRHYALTLTAVDVVQIEAAGQNQNLA